MAPRPSSILIVDDDADIRANLADIFTDFGYSVSLAPDGKSALQLASGKTFDVAILDLKMPGMDGLELYRRIKEIDSGVVAIIVTAYAASDTARSAIADGAWELLPKPVDLRRLMPMVEDALNRPMVILVDDDLDLCQTLWDILRGNRCRTSIAHDIDGAARLFDQRLFDVALVDLRLSPGCGTDVVTVLRRSQPQTIAVLITGYPDEVTTASFTGIHPLDCVMAKPLNIDAIVEITQQSRTVRM